MQLGRKLEILGIHIYVRALGYLHYLRYLSSCNQNKKSKESIYIYMHTHYAT